MRRYIGATLDQFESFFLPGAAMSFEDAAYPPCSGAAIGPLRFRRVRAGGVIVEVRRSKVAPSGDFLLDMLFTTGACPFPDPIDLARFWNGPLADAFGLPRGPLPEREQQSLLDDLYDSLPPEQQPAAKARGSGVRRRLPSRDSLSKRLETVICGQEPALQALSSLVVSELGKREPRRAATVLLIGPTGVGKTATVEALPAALAAEGWPGTHVHRIDCNELTDDYDVHRLLGSAPGLVGYTPSPPLIAALKKGGCIVLLDEIDKAHPSVQEALYSLLDTGRIMAPDGTAVCAPGTVVAMTSTAGADDLASRLHRVAPENRRTVERVVRTHLREQLWPAELVARIDTIAVYESLSVDARRRAASQAIQALGEEYGFSITALEPVLADVVLDLAEEFDLGVRGLHHAARQLLGETLAQAAVVGTERCVALNAGPPPAVSPADA
ncbi:MAG: AAA family ATPase [Acidimicrobiales bacterium]